MTRCPRCRSENRPGRRFCAACGAALEAACPACSAANEPGAAFCGECGAALAAEVPKPAGELRQVTVLFADLSGFTRLSARFDAEEMHALLGRFFETVDGIVERFGGTVDKHVGDSVMALFGAPVAHGNDAERAVRAALAMQAAVSRLADPEGAPLRLHAGIAGGQVLASGAGSSRHSAYTVIGESVNLAARLQERAGDGETLVADAVHRAVASLVAAEPAGELALDGFDRPVRAWRLTALAAETAPRAETPFVGRRGTLRQFAGLLEACQETGRGQAVLLRGEAGIGKTRLLGEFKGLAAARGFACHTGLVLDFGAGTGEDAIGALLRSLLGLAAGAEAAARETAIEAAIADGLVAAEARVFLNDMLDLPQPPALRALYDAMDAAARGRGKRALLAALVERAAGRRPLLLAIEDIHWADADALDHLAALTAAVRHCPAILIMTSRVEGDPLDGSWRARVRESPLVTVDLGPLRPEEAQALAEALLDGSGGLAARIADRAEGNPLFLEQLLRNIEDSDAEGVPASIQSLVLARMDRLPPPDRRLLQAASVVGQRFALDLVRHLLEEPAADCRALVERHLVRPEPDGWLFAHALIRESVYASLLKARRRALHRRAADWFAGRDPLLRARHLERAEDEAAPAAYREAALAEAAAYRPDRARELVEAGLVLARHGRDRVALLLLQGELLHDSGAAADSIEAHRGALALAEDDLERCRAWLGIAAGLRIIDRIGEALEAVGRAEALVGEGHPLERARLHHLRGNLYFPLGRIEECLGEHARSLAFARAAGSAEAEARALGGLGDAEYARGRMRTALGHFRDCVALARRLGLGRIEVANVNMIGAARLFIGDLQGMLAAAQEAAAAATRVGHQRAEMIALHGVCFAALEGGELALAFDKAEAATAIARRLGAGRFEAEGLALAAAARRLAGERAEALRLAREAVAVGRAGGMAYFGPALLIELAQATDDPAERAAALAEGDALLAAGTVAHNVFFFLRGAIDLALETGDYEAAERRAAALESFTRPEPLPWADYLVRRARALAAFGRGRRDADLAAELRQLAELARAGGYRTSAAALDATLAGF